MANAPGKFGLKALTSELRKLMAEVHTTTADGTPITKAEALADIVAKMALGWEEVTRDEMGNLIKKIHPPVAWAIQYVFERMEGKSAIATPENESGMKASDKVRELARDRVNALSKVTAGPPKFKPKRD